MEYGGANWDQYLQKDKDKLEKINRAARSVANDYERQSSVTAVLKKLEWPSLEQHHQLQNQRFVVM